MLLMVLASTDCGPKLVVAAAGLRRRRKGKLLRGRRSCICCWSYCGRCGGGLGRRSALEGAKPSAERRRSGGGVGGVVGLGRRWPAGVPLLIHCATSGSSNVGRNLAAQEDPAVLRVELRVELVAPGVGEAQGFGARAMVGVRMMMRLCMVSTIESPRNRTSSQ